ncbi:hypothetical protein [Reyranella soli]|jgi:hypothetical protein|uniref:Transmembrane protein n=1 Tax=Reyranella soli TaxID=1230389 RepID=A0A512N1J0_9HYPH|nr:hypothetical protein [Reyranella soli]GEP52852.1 hypothetical protein RSO01_00180 [Reyranella soli]
MAVVTTTTTPAATVVASDLPAGRYVDWGPIILGTLGALAIMVVLMTFGGALGLSIVSPQPYAGLSARALAVLAGLYAALVHVASFSAGGYLAGRMRTPWVTSDTVESHFRDGGHGFGVWALGVVVGAVLAVSGVSGVVKAITGATTAVAAAGTAGAAANPQTPAALQQISMQPTDYAVDRLLAPGPGAAAPAAAGGPATGSRADLAAPIARAFAANINNPQLDARDRAWLASLVSQRTGLPQADAEKRVDEAFAELKAAEQKARDAADKARKATLIAGFLAAATMAIGAAAACAGASLGARHRDDRTLVVLFGSRRFW